MKTHCRRVPDEEKPTSTEFDFPNQTPTQTVSLIPTRYMYTKVRHKPVGPLFRVRDGRGIC